MQIGETLPIYEDVRKMRTAILAEKLVERGHNVLWWASAFDHFKKKWINEDKLESNRNGGIKIRLINGIGYKRNVSLRRFIDHRIIAWKFKRLAPKTRKPCFIVASTPSHDLAYETVTFAKNNNIPVLVDIRDCWPDIFLNLAPVWAQNMAKIPLCRDYIAIKKTMRFATGLIAVTNTFLEWGLNCAGRKKTDMDRVFSLGYKKHKLLDSSVFTEKFENIMRPFVNKFIVFFVGTISSSYHNPFVILKAAVKLYKHKDIHFVISGDGELFEKLKAKSKGIDNITLTGWLNQNEIEYFLKQSKIGICPATRVVDLPTNKAFAYLSAGLPIVSSFHGEIKELIEENKIGLYYPPDNVDAFVGCIKKLHDDAGLYRNMSENAYNIFCEMFDADNIYDEYVDHIERVFCDYHRELLKG